MIMNSVETVFLCMFCLRYSRQTEKKKEKNKIRISRNDFILYFYAEAVYMLPCAAAAQMNNNNILGNDFVFIIIFCLFITHITHHR